MKKNGFIFLIVVLIIKFNNYAKADIHPGITVGIDIFKYSEKRIDGWYDYQNKNGFVGGALLEIQVLKLLFIEPSILYCMRGAYNESNSIVSAPPPETLNTKVTFITNYICLPFHAKLKIINIPLVIPYPLAGFNLGILLSSKKEIEETDNFHHSDEINDIKKYTSPIDLGFDIGGGIEIKIGKLSPFIEITYYRGLTSIAPNGTVIFKGIVIQGGIKFQK